MRPFFNSSRQLTCSGGYESFHGHLNYSAPDSISLQPSRIQTVHASFTWLVVCSCGEIWLLRSRFLSLLFLLQNSEPLQKQALVEFRYCTLSALAIFIIVTLSRFVNFNLTTEWEYLGSCPAVRFSRSNPRNTRAMEISIRTFTSTLNWTYPVPNILESLPNGTVAFGVLTRILASKPATLKPCRPWDSSSTPRSRDFFGSLLILSRLYVLARWKQGCTPEQASKVESDKVY